ncbi:hypothetical protein OSB04_015982 [Centaurea solstitialis]|uniref:F-box protein n=1 Tax=Centaurea solstitialis TaxID=347529 RepID=A0AA38TI85_9ASTR|nr:hypothetical protein OSB04_015982 [Centaurea solstitialis]
MTAINPSMENLPLEIMVDILSRVPVKTIVHCKCVCKKWHKLVNNSDFINLHLPKSPAGFMVQHESYVPDDATSGILKWVEIEDGLDDHTLQHEPVINFDLDGYLPAPVPFTDLIPVGSVNGLICISQRGNKVGVKVDNVYICNPITREYLTLPRPQKNRDGCGVIVYKFGVNSLTGEYKVLRIFQVGLPSYFTPGWPIVLEAEVYTLGTSQWRNLGQVPYRFLRFRGPFLNGYFHWKAPREDALESIFTFDLDKETFQLFPSPPSGPQELQEWSENLGVFKGCLCKSYACDSRFTIWVMKHYAVKESWHKELVIVQAFCDDRDWVIMKNDMYVFGGLQDGTILVVLGNKVLACCPKSKTIEYLGIQSTRFAVICSCLTFLQLSRVNGAVEDGIRTKPVRCMVSTRRNPSSEEPETPDLRDVIGSQVTETLHQILPGLFAQMKDEILAAVDQRIDTAFATHGSTSGSSSQAPGRAVTFKDFMACQPPHFEGRKDPIACFRWVAAVEGAFRTSGCPEGMKVFYAVNLLRNAGKDWWGLILKSRTEEQINAMTWDEFKVLLDEQFAPRIEKQRITSEFLNLAQTTETVNEITDQFLEKSLFCPDYVSTEEMKMFRYQGVLKPEIQEFVATARCKTFNDMVDVARTRELFLEEQQQGKRKAEQEPVPVKKSKGQRSDSRKEFSGCPKCGKNHSGECRLPEPVCFKCGKPGHRSRECRVEPRTCFHCFQPGHIKPNCPQLVGAAAAATPAPTPLMITDGSTGKKSGSTTGSRGRVFQLTAGEAEADPDMVAESEWGRAHRVRRRAAEAAGVLFGRKCVRSIRNYSRIDFGDEISVCGNLFVFDVSAIKHYANIPYDALPVILKWVEIEDKLDHQRLHHDPLINFDPNGCLGAPGGGRPAALVAISSVHGLICIWQRKFTVDNVYICNPITREEYLSLPRPRNYASLGLIVYAFGVSSLTGEYKVQWRSLGQVPYLFGGFTGSEMPFLNDNFHRIVYDKDALEGIFTFDLDKETFRLISSLPPAFEVMQKGSAKLGVFKGCLCKSDTYDFQFTIWVMKQYGIKESWHKELVITQAICAGLDWPKKKIMHVIEGLQDGSILVVHNDDKLLAYCPKRKTIKEIAILHRWCVVLTHRPSFIKLQNFDFDRVHMF